MNPNPDRLSAARLLKAIHGRDTQVFTSRHHARYFEDGTIYHVVSRVICGLALLVPNEEINDMIAGVLGHVQEKHPQIELFAHAFLSNHFHLALRGPGIPEFVGQLKQQISQRLKFIIDEPFETLWSGRYAATALIYPDDELRCFEYILSQGVKEGLVDTPEQWPGVHCAREVFFGEACRGRWLNATRYGEAKRAQSRKAPSKRSAVSKDDYVDDVRIKLTRLPMFEGLDELEYRKKTQEIRSRIIANGKTAREGKASLGVDAVLDLPRTTVFPMPRPPWFKDRKPMIAWSNPKRPETRAYLQRFHQRQREYDDASLLYRAGNRDVVFPLGMYIPPIAPRPGRRLAAA